jgi:hypothetical protein
MTETRITAELTHLATESSTNESLTTRLSAATGIISCLREKSDTVYAVPSDSPKMVEMRVLCRRALVVDEGTTISECLSILDDFLTWGARYGLLPKGVH